MLRTIKIAAVSVPALIASTIAASASTTAGTWWFPGDWNWGHDGGSNNSQVPEIDASTGLLAMAAIGAALLLSWEMKRRRAR
ncbi:VPEID-CTERM sorting domain-containing protein [Pseudodonghicola xiamenensis]|uniref:VPEID-CTERM protein sorting domain-containing protein n=1 Tax=Pseudodonghicola xiamenensis TaxID=337702 RepID=A0A8J3MDY7_9RHOB|nr:VPEID-CTERM sorting domain-containing protein [Pseudodonghicola xiamenensis]GHG93195.1 hypothetical protein GCM10010961_25590 [Pseudodonghicola xiamenensis]